MNNTENTSLRIPPALVDAVRQRHGLAGEGVSYVVRYALALAGGVDPAAARMRRGPRRKAGARAA